MKVDAHSELMTEYPWSFSGVTPNAADNLPDSAQYDDQAGALVFRDQGKLPHPNAPEHDYAAMVASTMQPVAGETGGSPNEYRGPQGTNVCTAEEPPSARATTARSERARAASCATRSPSPPVRQRPCGSPWRAPTRGLRRLAASSRPPFAIPGAQLAAKVARARALGPLLPALAAGRPAPPSGGRLGQAEPPRSHAGR